MASSRRKLLLPYVGLPNVLAGKFVVPELLQDDATVENLAQAALNLYDDTVTRRRLEALFAGFAASLARRYRRACGGSRHRRTAQRGRAVLIACSVPDRRHRRGRTRAAGRPGRRRRGDPRSGAAHRRPARFEGADGEPRASGLRSKSAPARSPGRSATADVDEIDALNILQATLLAMRRAVDALPMRPARRGSTATAARELACPTRAIVEGDRDVPAISAASILAKTARDAMLIELDARYPDYGFAHHKGYGTPEHLAALARHGPCPEHRRTLRAGRADGRPF